jgi:hypothetical protein
MSGAFGEALDALGGGLFGEGGAAWGAGAGYEAGEDDASLPSGAMDIGNGSSLQIDAAQIAEILRGPEVLSSLEQCAQELVEHANSTAQVEGAEYTYIVQAHEDYETPQIFLHAANFPGTIDDAAHSTLLKVAASVDHDVPINVVEEPGLEVLVPIASPPEADYRLPPGRSVWSRAAGR